MIFYLESWGKIGYSEKDSTACKYNDTMCFLGICVCTFVYIVLYKYSAMAITPELLHRTQQMAMLPGACIGLRLGRLPSNLIS